MHLQPASATVEEAVQKHRLASTVPWLAVPQPDDAVVDAGDGLTQLFEGTVGVAAAANIVKEFLKQYMLLSYTDLLNVYS